jgi:hypothetical protein
MRSLVLLIAFIFLALTGNTCGLILTQKALKEYAGEHLNAPELELENMKIVAIDENTFDDFAKYLIELDLSYNNLTKISPKVLLLIIKYIFPFFFNHIFVSINLNFLKGV